MANGKKLSLPLFSELVRDPDGSEPGAGAASVRPPNAALPTVDAARRNLGGRGSTTAGAGRVVALAGQAGVTVIGVVLYASEIEIDVWLDEGIVRRTKPFHAQPFHGVVDEALLKLADDARLFASLREGQRVRFEAAKGALADGAIVEKCRYGALVLREDGKLMAVGFRKLWPLVRPDTAPN